MDSLHIPLTEASLRLVTAAVLGAILGWDREAQQKPAGIRTFMLVSIGSAGFALIAQGMAEEARQSMVVAAAVDATRLLQGVVGGIGFIGAGAIIQSQGQTHGITTAAGIWLAAAVGISAGLGGFALAAMLTALGVVVLVASGLASARKPKDSPPTN